jgi:polyhydroxybutyrate depolymerase
MTHTISVAGRTRTFVVVGDADGPRDRPLIIVFHGSRQSGDIHRRFTGGTLDGLADERRAVVAYLDGYRGNWNDARAASAFPARRDDIDDVTFARDVIRSLAQSHGIDTAKVIGVGYSNGGQMILRLLHEADGLLAGAAIVAATMPERENFLGDFGASTNRPVPIAIVAGTADPIVPFGGGTMAWWARTLFRVGGASLSATATAEYFARRNGITDAPSTDLGPAPAPGRAAIDTVAYRQEGRAPVTLFVVRGGGHTVPGPAPAPRVVGRTGERPGIRDIVTDLWAATGDRGR